MCSRVYLFITYKKCICESEMYVCLKRVAESKGEILI